MTEHYNVYYSVFIWDKRFGFWKHFASCNDLSRILATEDGLRKHGYKTQIKGYREKADAAEKRD